MPTVTRMAKSTKATETQAFAERLRRALEGVGVRPSPTLVASEFNTRYWGRSITPHTARNWLLGISIPTQDKLRVLAEWLQVAPDLLRYGDQAPVPSITNGADDVKLEMQDREMLKKYLTLPISDKQIIRRVVSSFAVDSLKEIRKHNK